jgi:hypothetical protein
MAVKVSSDFRYKLRGQGEFSSDQAGFFFVESTALAEGNETEPPLQMHLHCEFMQQITRVQKSRCLWLVETASKPALALLQKRFPDHQNLGCSIAGYFEPEYGSIRDFWDIRTRLDKVESWNYEQPWALVGVFEKLPDPAFSTRSRRSRVWTLDHVFSNWQKVSAVFVQEGWFAYFGVKRSAQTIKLVIHEFPQFNSADFGHP